MIQPKPTVLALAAVISLLAGCKQAVIRVPDQPPIAVRVQVVERKRVIATEEAVGTVRAQLHAVIEARTSARIEKMLVVAGQRVAVGEWLVQLDAGEIQARRDQAVEQRDQTARDTERLRQLLAGNTISKQEFETAESRHRVASAAATEAETALGYTRITAPFGGVVTRKLAEVGDLASPGRALLEIEDSTSLRLEADVPESLVSRMELGAAMAVRTSQMKSELSGTVSEIAPAADSASRTFLVKIDLPASPDLRPGQFGRVAIPWGEVTALRIPASAVLQRGQMELVFIETNRAAQLRIVKTGKRVGEEVELLSGVEFGERVVIEGADRLREGQRLEIRP